MQAIDCFRANLVLIKDSLGMNQRQFAEEVEIDFTFLSKLLSGKTGMDVRYADKVAQKAGFQLWQLFLPPAQFSKKYLPQPARSA